LPGKADVLSLDLSLSQKQIQGHILTPKMHQMMRMLQLPLLGLETYLQEQLEENPLLEEEFATMDDQVPSNGEDAAGTREELRS